MMFRAKSVLYFLILIQQYELLLSLSAAFVEPSRQKLRKKRALLAMLFCAELLMHDAKNARLALWVRARQS